RQTIVGVNKYRQDSEAEIAILKVDNRAVRRQQLDKLKRLKAERNEAEVQSALDALTECAKTGKGNLLEGAVRAARAKATVGEISYALEKVYGRHRAEGSAATGGYKTALGGQAWSPRPRKWRSRGAEGGPPESTRGARAPTPAARSHSLAPSPLPYATSIAPRFPSRERRPPASLSRTTFMLSARRRLPRAI